MTRAAGDSTQTRLASSQGSPRASGHAAQGWLLLHSPARMREWRKKQQNPEESGLAAMHPFANRGLRPGSFFELKHLSASGNALC